MKWVSTNKWLTWGFVSQCSGPIGGPPTGQVLDHMSSFQAFVWACLCGNSISCGLCACRFNGPYIHCRAGVGPATETNWYIQVSAPFGLHDTFQMDKKRAFYSVENLEKSLVAVVMVQLKQPWAIKLQSDVNLGCSQPHREKAAFTRETQIKQFVCQFTCHLNEFLLVSSLFKWRELQTIIDL